MLAVVLALGCAVTYGIADFLGGVLARRAATLAVVVGSQFFGLLILVILLPVLPPATVTATDLWWGAAAGMAGGCALIAFFTALSRGSITVVAPISALLSGTLPVVAGVAFGERPSALAWLGIAAALPAVALISRERDDAHLPVTAAIVRMALLAGVGFGAFFVLIDRTGDGAGIQPLIAARSTSVILLGVIGLRTGRLAWVRGRDLGLLALSGVLDMTANVLFLYATREGLLALGSVLAAMYPASTLVLARIVLGERLQRIQLFGLGLAAGAVTLVALG